MPTMRFTTLPVSLTGKPKQRRQRKKKAAAGMDDVGNGMTLVAPPAETGTRTAKPPAAARSSQARWQMQGFSSSKQVRQSLVSLLTWAEVRDNQGRKQHTSQRRLRLASSLCRSNA